MPYFKGTIFTLALAPESGAAAPQSKTLARGLVPPISLLAAGSGDQFRALRQNLPDDFAVIAIKTFATGNFEAARVESETAHYRGVNVRDAVAILDGVEAELIRDPVLNVALHAGTREPRAEAFRMMIAIAAFRTRRATAFWADDDKRVVQNGALLRPRSEPRRSRDGGVS